MATIESVNILYFYCTCSYKVMQVLLHNVHNQQQAVPLFKKYGFIKGFGNHVHFTILQMLFVNSYKGFIIRCADVTLLTVDDSTCMIAPFIFLNIKYEI